MTETSATAVSTDRLERLAEVRDLLRAAMDRARPSSLAGLSKEYRNVLADIDTLMPTAERNPLDELVARRKLRLSGQAST